MFRNCECSWSAAARAGWPCLCQTYILTSVRPSCLLKPCICDSAECLHGFAPIDKEGPEA